MPLEREPGTAPLKELLVPGELVMLPPETYFAEAMVAALRESDGQIVATWDEGRWWTPEESDAFLAAIVAEMTAH
jgi:hypothetical protein